MNRKIFYLFIFGFALLFIIMLLPKSEAACSGIAPPGYAYGVWPKGSTWIIDAKTECSGETIYAMGDVSIKANGELVLNSSKLIFVLESDGQYKLEVEAQGKLTVKNSVITSFSIVKDLQVLVTLDTKTLIDQGKMRADGGDIRFTDEFGNQLNYWIEPQYVRLFPNSGFETGGLANWTEEVCCAWSIRGPGDTNAGRGHEGNYQADSLRRSGEAAVGTIRSENFKIVGDYITFLIGGWSSINVVQLVNASDGAVLLSTSAPNCDCWRAVSWDVMAYRGREVYIRAIDANPGGGAAWFSIDDFKQIITVYSNETRIWVKTNPVKGRVNKIYLNYGKSDATSLSSAKDTFIPDNIFLRTGGWRGEYAGAYAYSHRDFDNVLNNFNKTFNIGIGRIGYVERVDHGFMGWDWYYPDHFFHQYKFLFVPSSTKNYLFGTDGDDGVELIWNDGDKDIRHETIASWFGGHGTCWCWNPSYWNGRPLVMGQGVWFEFRQQEWGGGEYARMGVNPNYEGWRTMHKSNFPGQIFARKYFPSDPAYTVKAEVTGSTLTGWGYNKPIEIDLTGRQYDYSTPQAREENYYYKFIVKKDGIMDIEGSDISGTWGIVGPDQTTDVYGGIQIYSSFVTIKNSKIHDSKVMGIYVNGVSIMMENLDVYNNGRGVETTHIHKSVPYHGIWWVGMSYSSGIYLVSSAPSIESSYIHDNFYRKYSADYGGYYWVGTWHRIYGTGIYMVNSNPYIGNSTIKYNGHDNESTEQNYGDCGWGKCLKAERGTGSGIYGYRSSPTVYNCTIMRNFVGIYINEHKPQEMEKTFPVIIENCYIAENWDARDHHWRIYRGIGIFFESVWLGTILNNTIEYNGRPYTEARGWYDMYWAQGFGILFRSSKTDILSNIIRYNWRGIFFWESSMGRIAYNQIVWNTVRPHEPPWWWWWSFPWWYYWTWHWKFHGIGIWLETSCNPIIEYNEISHNGDKYTAQFMHNYWETCDESYGIRAHGGSNPIIRYNNITWNGYFGVRSYDSSSPEVYNNNVSWNGFKAYDHSWGIGVFVGYAATWKIYNNTIMFNGNHHAGGAWGWGWGIISDWHSTAMIVNNTIQRNWCGMRLHGCRLGSIIERNNISYNGFTYWWYPRGVGISIYVPISWGGQFPVIKNNYIGYNGFYGGHGPSVDYWWQAGIHSYVGGSNAKIGAGNVLDSNEYAFAIWSTSLTITDTVIKNSFSSDFFITDSTSITLINNTHEKGRIIFGDDSSTIKAFWYVDFKVIWKETKAPVQSAGLDLYDNSERYTFSAYTDMEGKTKRYIVQEYENSRVRWLSYTPYRIEVFIKGKSIANETVSINRTMSVLLEIEESSPPKISIVEPEENASFSSHIVQLIGTADDDESGVHVVDIAVGAGNWIRIPGYGLTTWNYTLELPADGDYTVFAKATDRAGNYDVDWVKFTVKEAEPFFHVTFPPNDYITSTPTVRVTGIADRGLTISVNGEEVSVYERAFSKYVDLIEGNNIIKVEAKDIVGNVRTESRVVILDTIKPFIQINFPPDNYETNENIVKVDGITEEGADITVNGEGVPTIRGSFVKDVVLKTGPNAIYIEAIDKAGNQNSTILDVKYDNVPPDLSVFTPHQNALLNRTDVKVTGVTEEDAILTINDKKVDIRAGRFDSLLTLIEGNNTIVITASDTAGNKNTIIRNVFVDTVPPMLVVIEPRQGEITNKLTIQVSGTTEVGARVYIGGSEIPVFNGTFCTNVTLLDNILNNITVTAEDIVKNSRTVTREVRVDTQPPGLTVTEPEDGFKVRKGTLIIVGVTEPDIVELEVNGKPLTWDTMTGQFSGSLELVTGKNVITVTAKDSAGNVATVTKEGEYTIEKAGISFGIYSWLWLIFGLIIGTCVTFPVIIALTRRHLRKKFEEYGIEPYEIEEPEEIEEPGEIEEPEKIEEEDLGPEEIEEELPPEEEER